MDHDIPSFRSTIPLRVIDACRQVEQLPLPIITVRAVDRRVARQYVVVDGSSARRTF